MRGRKALVKVVRRCWLIAEKESVSVPFFADGVCQETISLLFVVNSLFVLVIARESYALLVTGSKLTKVPCINGHSLHPEKKGVNLMVWMGLCAWYLQ